MIKITSNEQARKMIASGVLKVDDDIEIAFDGFDIEADLICHNIYSNKGKRDIKLRNITARDIFVGNIDSGNIDAWSITAENVNYYAFCVAYKGITCESINGRREIGFHKCLDGEIVILPKKRIITLDNKQIELSEESYQEFVKQFKGDK